LVEIVTVIGPLPVCETVPPPVSATLRPPDEIEIESALVSRL
jgi:hypothetical protein